MTRDKRGTSYDGEEVIKGMEPIFEDMTNNIMKGFKYLAIKIWEHLGQFGGLDIKTSQGSKLGKKWKNCSFNKISKLGHYSGIIE